LESRPIFAWFQGIDFETRNVNQGYGWPVARKRSRINHNSIRLSHWFRQNNSCLHLIKELLHSLSDRGVCVIREVMEFHRCSVWFLFMVSAPMRPFELQPNSRE
jgi:hypothetical protein